MERSISRNKLFVLIVLVFLLLIGALLFLITRGSKAEVIPNDTRIATNTDLVYYLDVVYDGIDKNVKVSSSEAVSKVYSDYIYVEDRIPEGLEFVRFVTSSDGSVGAVKQSDNTSCQGYVVGNKDGLKYNPRTKKISFKIKNLQAGCKLTIGIVTKTPRVIRNDRMDFYNTISVKEKGFFRYSNLEHTFLGKDEPLHSVTYKYEGDLPTNVGSAPEGFGYSEGALVEVLGDIHVDGYDFSGWKSSDVEVNNNTFVMPGKSVTFTGRFSKSHKYKVKYDIIGDIPEGYIVPSEKEVFVNSDVKIDSLSKGNVIGDYAFMGWNVSSTCGDVKIQDRIFTMPNCNVTITGSFTKKMYTVSYKFRGDELPENYLELLPKTKYYAPGDIVNLEDYPNAEGYKFLGWLNDDKFTMGKENVVIYGQCMKLYGYFTPSIRTKIIDEKEYYHNNDEVTFAIKVKNNDDFNINDIMIKSDLSGFKFVNNNNYTVLNDNNVKINDIEPYKSVMIYGKCKANNELSKVTTNVFEIVGGIADNNYYLNDHYEYKDSASFNTSNIGLVVQDYDSKKNEVSGSNYSLYDSEVLSLPIAEGLNFKELSPEKTYYLKQNKNPDGFMKNSEVYKIRIDRKGVLKIDNHSVELDKNTYSLKLSNRKVNMLPVAGGIGVYPFVLSGLLLVVIGFIIFIKNYKEDKNTLEELEII